MAQPDLRPTLTRTQDWVAGLVEGVDDGQWDVPSGCQGWTVADLVEHLLAVQGRIEALPTAGSVDHLPTHLPLPESDLGTAFREAADRATRAWADDEVLDQEMSPPWGTMPGRAVLGGYVQEHLAHGWDLAAATGQDGEALGKDAAAILPMAQEFVPAEIRHEEWIPFGPVIEPAADAGPTEQLANWLGRTTRADS